jgi:hypothetical protein
VQEFTSYQFRDCSYEFSDVCDFALAQNPMMGVAFAAVTSDLFKEEIQRVYQAAELNIQQQQQDEILFEKTREASSTTTGRRQGLLSFDIKK